jgi:diamine N-acetyltransferase
MSTESQPEQDLLVVGERVALGPLRRDLAPTYARWVNDPEVRFGLEHLGIATPESEETWIDERVKEAAEREPKSAPFTVYDLSDREPIGTTSLFSISYMHGSATLGIVLGERRIREGRLPPHRHQAASGDEPWRALGRHPHGRRAR